MFVTVPVNVVVASAEPSPTEKESPAVPFKDSVPFAAVNVTCTAEVPASASAMRIGFVPAVKSSEVSSLVACPAGTVLTGATFGTSRFVTERSTGFSPLKFVSTLVAAPIDSV